jgi:hypothetical protein
MEILLHVSVFEILGVLQHSPHSTKERNSIVDSGHPLRAGECRLTVANDLLLTFQRTFHRAFVVSLFECSALVVFFLPARERERKLDEALLIIHHYRH